MVIFQDFAVPGQLWRGYSSKIFPYIVRWFGAFEFGANLGLVM
jgi:hypothetical protein